MYCIGVIHSYGTIPARFFFFFFEPLRQYCCSLQVYNAGFRSFPKCSQPCAGWVEVYTSAAVSYIYCKYNDAKKEIREKGTFAEYIGRYMYRYLYTVKCVAAYLYIMTIDMEGKVMSYNTMPRWCVCACVQKRAKDIIRNSRHVVYYFFSADLLGGAADRIRKEAPFYDLSYNSGLYLQLYLILCIKIFHDCSILYYYIHNLKNL